MSLAIFPRKGVKDGFGKIRVPQVTIYQETPICKTASWKVVGLPLEVQGLHSGRSDTQPGEVVMYLVNLKLS